MTVKRNLNLSTFLLLTDLDNEDLFLSFAGRDIHIPLWESSLISHIGLENSLTKFENQVKLFIVSEKI